LEESLSPPRRRRCLDLQGWIQAMVCPVIGRPCYWPDRPALLLWPHLPPRRRQAPAPSAMGRLVHCCLSGACGCRRSTGDGIPATSSEC